MSTQTRVLEAQKNIRVTGKSVKAGTTFEFKGSPEELKSLLSQGLVTELVNIKRGEVPVELAKVKRELDSTVATVDALRTREKELEGQVAELEEFVKQTHEASDRLRQLLGIGADDSIIEAVTVLVESKPKKAEPKPKDEGEQK